MIQILELHLEEPILVRFSVENMNRWRHHHVLLLTKSLHHLCLTFYSVDHGSEEQHTWVLLLLCYVDWWLGFHLSLAVRLRRMRDRCSVS